MSNKALFFNEIPTEFPEIGKHLVLQDLPIDPNQDIQDGAVLLKNAYYSLDPYMRGRMRPAHIKSYTPAFDLKQPITSNGIARVLKSKNEKFKEGDIVIGFNIVSNYSVIPKEHVGGLKKLENPLGLPESHFLGVLGMPGLTAYSSFYDIGQPKEGETIFVTSAAGAVGALVGQLAKREKLKVIGSAGTDDKVEYLKSLGFDAAWNYKKISTKEALKQYAPEGIDIFYDNVGGEQLDAAMEHANNHARFVECGMISQYNLKPEDRYPHKNLFLIVSKRLTLRGFIVGDENMGPRYVKERDEKVSRWIKNGELHVKEHVVEGIENAAQALLDVFHGNNFGKMILKVGDL